MNAVVEPEGYRICRVCMMNCFDNYLSIYNNSEGYSLVDMLVHIAQVEIQENDILPKNICLKCSESVIIAFNIIRTCQNSDETMRALLQRTDFDQNHKEPTNSNSNQITDELKFDAYEILMNEIMQYDESMLKDRNQESLQMIQELNHHIQSEMQKNNEASSKPKKKKPNRTCCGCKLEFEGDSKLKEHSKTIHKIDRVDKDPEKPFECIICYRRFTTDSLLKEHNRIIYKKYKCHKCNKKFMTRANLNNHIKHHPETITKICCGCKKHFLNDEDLEDHVREMHEPNRVIVDENRPFECKMCFRRYPSRKSLISHKRMATQYQCEECGEIFLKKSYLEAHNKEIHAMVVEKKICCGCRAEFPTVAELKKHSDLVHKANPELCDDPTKLFACDICYKRVSSKEYLKQHKRKVYNTAKHQCKTCGKSFNRPYELTIHENIHKQETPFVCPACGKGFKNKVYLKSHIKTHTETEKSFVCDECGRGFRTKDLLKSHKISHSDERIYQCSSCPSTFKRLHSLKNHLRTHSTEKQFICHICQKSYVQSSDLKRHMQSHDLNAKPFKCDTCGKSYPRKDYLKTHIAKQHQAEIHQEEVPQISIMIEANSDLVQKNVDFLNF